MCMIYCRITLTCEYKQQIPEYNISDSFNTSIAQLSEYFEQKLNKEKS